MTVICASSSDTPCTTDIESPPHRAELQPDDARTDQDEVLRHLRIPERLGARADAVAVDVDPFERGHPVQLIFCFLILVQLICNRFLNR